MQTDNSIRSSDARALRTDTQPQTGVTGEAKPGQRVVDAAAPRVSPVDEAQISPLARALAAEEQSEGAAGQQAEISVLAEASEKGGTTSVQKSEDAAQKPAAAQQQQVDDRRAPERQADAQRTGKQQAASRFEVVA